MRINSSKIGRRVGAFTPLGESLIGLDRIQVFAQHGEKGAHFHTTPDTVIHPDEAPRRGRMIIGIDYDEWRDVLEGLYHEALEWAMMTRHCRFAESDSCAITHGAYLFIMTHVQFQEVCAMASEFIVDIEPRLMKLYAAERRKLKRKKKRPNEKTKVTRNTKRRPSARKRKRNTHRS